MVHRTRSRATSRGPTPAASSQVCAKMPLGSRCARPKATPRPTVFTCPLRSSSPPVAAASRPCINRWLTLVPSSGRHMGGSARYTSPAPRSDERLPASYRSGQILALTLRCTSLCPGTDRPLNTLPRSVVSAWQPANLQCCSTSPLSASFGSLGPAAWTSCRCACLRRWTNHMELSHTASSVTSAGAFSVISLSHASATMSSMS
mmetsp:Transcript_166875/g.535662  ORF Transcript_166875/g.535662 Transcript_166875/m.535662 type:complete len:204 (-) Transcript_166875:1219-1830(-)